MAITSTKQTPEITLDHRDKLYTLEQKLERAARQYLEADTTFDSYGIDVYEGEDDEIVKVPHVVIFCDDTEEHIRGTGNYFCTLTVRFVESMDEVTPQTHRSRTATINDLFAVDNIGSLLDAYVMELTIFGQADFETRKSVEDRKFVKEFDLRILACPSAVTP